MDRGIIFGDTADFWIENNRPHMDIHLGIREDGLRKGLLYWDKVCYVAVNPTEDPLAYSEELTRLRERGAFLEESVEVTAAEIGMEGRRFAGMTKDGMPLVLLSMYVACAQRKTAEKFQQSDGGTWNIAQYGRQLAVPIEAGAIEDIIELQLAECLPAPAPDTPLEAIVDFKDERKDELLRFQIAMADMKEGILNASDKQAALTKSTKEIELALIEIGKVMDEKGINKIYSTLDLFLGGTNADTIKAIGAALGAKFAQGLEYTVELGAFGGGLLSGAAINLISKRLAGYRELNPDLERFVYLYNVQKKLSEP